MTVFVEGSTQTYNGDGSTTVFPTVFVFNVDTDIQVVERDLTTGVETPKTNPTDYTVTGGGGANVSPEDGDVIANIAPPLGVSWTLTRVTPSTQDTSLPTAGPFPAKSVEGMSDQLTLLVQQNEAKVNRAITIPESDPDGITTELPASVNRANMFQAFDAGGNVTVAAGTGGGYIDPLTVRGDVLRRGVSTTQRLALGPDGAAVVSDGTDTIYGAVGPAGIRAGAVETVKINDKAVTSAKLADGTAGELITWDAGGVASTVPTGAVGGVLTSNGPGTEPTFQAGAVASGWVPLDQQVISGTPSSVDFTSAEGFDPSTYDEFQIAFFGLVVTNGSAVLMARFGTGGGPTFESGASDYNWGIAKVDNVASATNADGVGDESDNAIKLSEALDTNTRHGHFGTINVFGSQSTDNYPGLTWNALFASNGSTRRKSVTGSGAYNNSEAVISAITAIQLLPSAGTFSGGTFALFGRTWT